jgi:hypothetical protein
MAMVMVCTEKGLAGGERRACVVSLDGIQIRLHEETAEANDRTDSVSKKKFSQ